MCLMDLSWIFYKFLRGGCYILYPLFVLTWWLFSADLDVRRKAISIVLSMTSSRNVEEVVLFLKKQLQRTQESDLDKASEYRQLLIQSIHVTAVKFSEIAASVVHALLEFLGDASSSSALHVVAFVRYSIPSPTFAFSWTQYLTPGRL